MRTEFWRHKLAYLLLLIGIAAFLFYFFKVWPDRVQQRLASGLFVCFYFVWGLLFHVKSNRLTVKIALEYFAASLLAGIILLLVTL